MSNHEFEPISEKTQAVTLGLKRCGHFDIKLRGHAVKVPRWCWQLGVYIDGAITYATYVSKVATNAIKVTNQN